MSRTVRNLSGWVTPERSIVYETKPSHGLYFKITLTVALLSLSTCRERGECHRVKMSGYYVQPSLRREVTRPPLHLTLVPTKRVDDQRHPC
jgi:hypothetical protein